MAEETCGIPDRMGHAISGGSGKGSPRAYGKGQSKGFQSIRKIGAVLAPISAEDRYQNDTYLGYVNLCKPKYVSDYGEACRFLAKSPLGPAWARRLRGARGEIGGKMAHISPISTCRFVPYFP